MGCASSKEAEPERPVRQISGPVGVVKTTPTIKAMHEAQTGQLAMRIVPNTAKHSLGLAKSSPRAPASRIHTSQARAQSTEPHSTLKKHRSAPIEILPAEEECQSKKPGRSLTLPGGKVSLATSPLEEKQPHRRASTLEEPFKETGPVRLDVDAFLAGKWSGATLAVGRCNTVSFSNPLKSASASNQAVSETPLASGNSPYSEPRRTSKEASFSLKPPTPKSPSFVASWLEGLHLGQYAAAFEAAGYEESDTLTNLSNSDLAQIERYTGVTILPGHKKRLILASCRPPTGQSPSLSKPASPYDSLDRVRTPDTERLFPDAENGLSSSDGGRVLDKNRRLHSDRGGKLSDGQTDNSGEIDGISSRATDSANSSPASVLPCLVLPQSLAEARRGGHSIRGKSTPLTEALPNGQVRWPNESRKAAEGDENRESFGGGSAKNDSEAGDSHKRGLPRRSKRSPRKGNSLKAAQTSGEGAEMRGVSGPPKLETDAAIVQPVGRAAELQALRAQVQKKVEELQLIHAKDMQASQLPPAARG